MPTSTAALLLSLIWIGGLGVRPKATLLSLFRLLLGDIRIGGTAFVAVAMAQKAEEPRLAIQRFVAKLERADASVRLKAERLQSHEGGKTLQKHSRRSAIAAVTFASITFASCAGLHVNAKQTYAKRSNGAISSKGLMKWTNFQENDGNNAVISGNSSYRWTFSPHSRINGSLAVVGRSVYVDTFGKNLYSLDIATGAPRWRAHAQGVLMSTPIVYHGLVFVGTGTNRILYDSRKYTIWGRPKGDFIDAFRVNNGTMAWSFHTVGEDMPTPAIVKGLLIFGNGDMHAYALSPQTGHLVWRRSIPGVTTMSSTGQYAATAIIIASRGIDYLLKKDATHVLEIDARSGNIVWSSIRCNSDCSPTTFANQVICEGTVYQFYGDDQLGLMGKNDIDDYDAKSGQRLWRWESKVGYFTSVGSNERGISGMVDRGVLYQSVPVRDEMVAINASTGDLIWKIRTAAPVKMSPVIFQSNLIFGDTAGLLYVVNARNGTIRFLRAEKLPFTTSAPVIFGKTLLIANFNRLMAIPLKDLGIVAMVNK